MKILLALVVLIVVFAVFVATRPSAFHIERSARMAAPPAAVFAQVTSVPPAAGLKVKVAVLVAAMGFRNSRRIVMRSVGLLSVIVILPSPTCLLPTQA